MLMVMLQATYDHIRDVKLGQAVVVTWMMRDESVPDTRMC